MRLRFNVHVRQGFTLEMTEKHANATFMLEQAINSVEFYRRVMTFQFTSTPLSNKEIYSLIMSGSEVLDPEVDHEADIYVHAYYKWGKVVGYTYPDIKETYVNTKFFNTYNFAGIAGNMAHEWFHKIGFDHVNQYDHKSVPYACGYILEELVERIMSGEILKQMDGTIAYENQRPAPIQKKHWVCYRPWRYLKLKKICYYK